MFLRDPDEGLDGAYAGAARTPMIVPAPNIVRCSQEDSTRRRGRAARPRSVLNGRVVRQ